MPPRLYSQLSLMMFLEWFVMGAWISTVGNYMGELGYDEKIFGAYAMVPISAIVAPYFLGLVADRYFSTEKVIGLLHIVGGVAMFGAPWVLESFEGAVVPFLGLILVHCLCFTPTIGLTSSLAFHHMTNPEKQFPIVRVFGTIGWIAAGVLVSRVMKADVTGKPLMVAGIAGLVFGIYSFTLPHTPPAKAGERATFRSIIDVDAITRLMTRPFAVFLIFAFLIWIPMQAYYTYNAVFLKDVNIAYPAFMMTFGQMSEIIFMILIPVFLVRLGVKWMFAAGLAAWLLRYSLLSGATVDQSLWMIMAAIILHGICFDFLFVVGQIYVVKKTPADMRGQAQGLFVFVTCGLGQLMGAFGTGWLFNTFVVSGDHSLEAWRTYWAVPAACAGVIMLGFSFLFWDPEVERKIKSTENSENAERL